MALRSGHGTGAGVPRIEVLPPDEQPPPVPGEPESVTGVTRRQNGTLATSEAAKALGAKGGRVKATKVRLARSLGLGDLQQIEAFKPYERSASAFRRHHCRELAAQAGGECGSGPSSIVASAALQLAASRYLFTLAGSSGDVLLFKQASQLANDSRQNLLAAYELAVREATARGPAGDQDLASVNRAAEEETARRRAASRSTFSGGGTQ